jgi:hypothetical protein
LSAAFFISSCHSPAGDQRLPAKDTTAADNSHPQLSPRHNPELRVQVKKEPVAQYHEQTGRPEGDFVVRLYETTKTMYYRADVEYEGLPGSDTVKVPDLGTAPRPALQKGADRFSCVIGFLDNDNRFRELKLVHANGDQLKITTVKHWVVTDHYRLVNQ